MKQNLVINRLETEWNEGRSSEIVKNITHPSATIHVRTKGYSDHAHHVTVTNMAVEDLGDVFSYLNSMIDGQCYWMKIYFAGGNPPKDSLEKVGFTLKDVFYIKPHSRMSISAFPNGFGGSAKEWVLSFQNRSAKGVSFEAVSVTEELYAKHGGQKNIIDDYFGEVISS